MQKNNFYFENFGQNFQFFFCNHLRAFEFHKLFIQYKNDSTKKFISTGFLAIGFNEFEKEKKDDKNYFYNIHGMDDIVAEFKEGVPRT